MGKSLPWAIDYQHDRTARMEVDTEMMRLIAETHVTEKVHLHMRINKLEAAMRSLQDAGSESERAKIALVDLAIWRDAMKALEQG